MSQVEYPLNKRVLAIQKTALDHLFDPSVLSRLQNDALQADKDDRPLTLAEMFRGLTDGVWNDAATDGKKSLQSSVMRRNL
jgi:Met-zincin